MHSALQRVLGTHVAQKGSLVNDESLRFDFSHFGKMTDEEITQVETMVNAKIQEGIALLEHRNIPIQNAIDMGATALFGEKYGDFVRVIEFDRAYSMELCGGTHVANTSQIGFFKLISEGSVSAGVRRIEAITNEKAMNYIAEKLQLLTEISECLNNPKDILQAIQKLFADNNQLSKKIESFENIQIAQIKAELMTSVQQSNGLNIVQANLQLPSAEAAKQLCFQLKQELPNMVCILGYTADEKPGLAIYIEENLVAEKGWDASAMVRECGKFIQGGGGGQKFFATAGGKDAAGLDNAIAKAREILGL